MRHNVLVLAASFVALVACGGSNPEAKDASNSDAWKDFTGKYSTPAEPRGSTSAAKESPKSAKAKAEQKEQTEETAPATPSKKTSKATIKGESLSSIGELALADASKGSLKTKVVSTRVLSGREYESVRIQLKGASVTIIRPVAAGEAGNGAVDAPKSRASALSKSEAGYYDEDADVAIIVDSGKKNASERSLAALVSR